jgi:hypothetical protein
MSDPTPVTRAVTYERDNHRCATCGTIRNLQYQHRAAVGAGGSKIRPGLVDGITSCAICNPAYEGRLQAMALRYGWKVRSWVRDRDLMGDVPVYYLVERKWYQLTAEGERKHITTQRAMWLMHAVYGDQYDPEKGLAA